MEELMVLISQYAVFPIALACFGVGWVIKHYVNEVPNKYIPLILAVVGLIMNIVINDFNVTLEVLATGAASGLIATGSFEAVRNLLKKQNEEVKAE